MNTEPQTNTQTDAERIAELRGAAHIKILVALGKIMSALSSLTAASELAADEINQFSHITEKIEAVQETREA